MSEARKYGYIRISSKDQNEARQVDAMRAAGIADRDIIIEKKSGKDFQREQYQTLKKFLRLGDVLYVKELDRLGRNKQQILDEWRELTKSIGVDIVVMDMPVLDTTKYKSCEIDGIQSLVVDLTLTLLSYFAEEERRKIKTRQAEGIAAAKSRGKHLGRPPLAVPKDFDAIYTAWIEKKITARHAMDYLDLKPSSFYKLVRERRSRH